MDDYMGSTLEMIEAEIENGEHDDEPDGADDQPDWRLAAMDCRYRESLGYPESAR